MERNTWRERAIAGEAAIRTNQQLETLLDLQEDNNAYVPAYNSNYAQPLSGNREQDYANNRSKRMLADLPSLLAARSDARYLIQRTRLETGEVLYDLSVPITVRGKHWGCARVGFRRTE